jgi:hypothetical protein
VTEQEVTMSNPPRDKQKAESKDGKPGVATSHGGLYDRHGPIPVPEASESDTESAWALFEESRMLLDNPPSVIPPKFEETKTDAPGFEPTDFGNSAFDSTMAAPLKP